MNPNHLIRNLLRYSYHSCSNGNRTLLKVIAQFSTEPKKFNRMGTGSSKESMFVNEQIQNNCVVIFSKTTCGFCRMAKRVFDDMGVPYVAIELNHRQDGSQLQVALQNLTGEATVPRVFVNQQCIGGGAETRNLSHEGKLLELIKQCSPKLI